MSSRRVAPTSSLSFISFFFTDTATTDIYTLSLHDALPISFLIDIGLMLIALIALTFGLLYIFSGSAKADRKSTRLNSSHPSISYAVFCLKKKNKHANQLITTLGLSVKEVTFFSMCRDRPLG